MPAVLYQAFKIVYTVLVGSARTMMDAMRFFDCHTAPSPRRIRILIAEKGLNLETVQVDLGAGEHLGAEFGRINPYRSVPVLELEDGTALTDSNAISMFLDETFPEVNLTGRTVQERAVIAMWQRQMDMNGLEAVAECFRNSAKGLRDRALVGRRGYKQLPELADRGRLRVQHFFTDLDERFGQSEYVAGDRFTIADITALVAVDFARAIKEPIPAEAANLQRWHAGVSARSGAVR